MEKLRNSKLQAIIANCELELCLSNFEAESETKKSSRKRKNAEIQPFKKSQLIS